MIDNYDSFTYNLYQLIGTMYEDIKVYRNDAITIEEIEMLDPEALIISPGPGYPADAGITIEAIKHFAPKIPILGVCLGHQAICEVFGLEIKNAKKNYKTMYLLYHSICEMSIKRVYFLNFIYVLCKVS